jgi:hypothetical protein
MVVTVRPHRGNGGAAAAKDAQMKLAVMAIVAFGAAGGLTFFFLPGASFGWFDMGSAESAALEQRCHRSYQGVCLPIDAPDVDCEGREDNGPIFVSGPFRVVGTDEYHLDPDRDGIACEAAYWGVAAE